MSPPRGAGAASAWPAWTSAGSWWTDAWRLCRGRMAVRPSTRSSRCETESARARRGVRRADQLAYLLVVVVEAGQRVTAEHVDVQRLRDFVPHLFDQDRRCRHAVSPQRLR